jgi:GDP-D-mannose dehydratase
MRTKRTLITGIDRPGGSYLAVLLPEKDFEVHGKSFSTGTCSISVRWSRCCATPNLRRTPTSLAKSFVWAASPSCLEGAS